MTFLMLTLVYIIGVLIGYLISRKFGKKTIAGTLHIVSIDDSDSDISQKNPSMYFQIDTSLDELISKDEITIKVNKKIL